MPDLSVPPQPVSGHGLLAGRVAVITAAAGTGIGSATARRMLDEGADVVVSDWHERRLKQTQEELAAEFPQRKVASVVCDVTSTEQVDELIRAAAQRLGRIDIMVNNAGLGGETPVVDMT
ncbi:SDR family NAD(P)-dependent oxidoreductase, partial [Nocardia sp. BSTN01]|uniref:SDR family NAD(P)-dependent oxidoreductase n=1 Tax=Nocardia sp. BSTN01 TaxID=2783665 RepID=UPI00188E80F1